MRRVVSAAFVLGAIVAGCGGSDDEPAPVDAPPQPALELASAERIRGCLTDAGFDVVAGERDPQDRDAPDAELSTSIAGGPVFVAVYESPRRARKLAPDLEREARRLGGTYELQGGVGVLIIGEQPTAHRKPIEACAFS